MMKPFLTLSCLAATIFFSNLFSTAAPSPRLRNAPPALRAALPFSPQEAEQPGKDVPAASEAPDPFALLEEGRAAEALEAFRKALDRDPENPALLTGAGRAAFRSGDLAAAIRFLSNAVRLDPSSYEAVLFEARAFAAQGRELFYSGERNDGFMMLQDATTMYDRAAGLDASSVDPLLEEAAIRMETGDRDGADAAAAAALERDPKCVEALLVRGDVAAMHFREAAGAGEPADRVKEKWHEAMALYEKARDIDPKATGSYMGMGALLEADKKWDEASETIMKALVLDPELLQGYNKLIALFGNAEGRKKLVGILDTLVERIGEEFPGDEKKKATPCYYAGFAHFLNFEWQAAVDSYAAAMKANPRYRTGAVYYIARARFAMNDYDKAARDFFRIITADPEGFKYFLENDSGRDNVCLTLSYLSNHCYEAGNLNMARELIGGILSVKKDNPDFFNNYGFLCRETGRYEDAYNAYLQALSLEPHNPSTLNDTALILQYHLHRDLDYARELYKRSIEEARRILNDGKAATSDKENARTALRDATNNLQKMSGGKRRVKKGKAQEPNSPPSPRPGAGKGGAGEAKSGI